MIVASPVRYADIECSSFCSAPWGLFTTLHSLSKIIVARCFVSYGVHLGNSLQFGLPVCANAVHALLIFVASGYRSAPDPTYDFARSTLSKANGISMACGVRSFPSRTGVRQVK